MPKIIITHERRLKEFPDAGLHVKTDKIWCSFCDSFIDYEKKSKIKNHVESAKHVFLQKKAKEGKLKQLSLQFDKDTDQWDSMVDVFIKAGIPLHVFKQKDFTKWMKSNLINGVALPSETTLRRKLLKLGKMDIQTTMEICRSKDISIMVDESTDIKNRKVLSILVAPFEVNASYRMLVAKFVEQCNSEIIVEEIMEALRIISCPMKNFLCLVTDGAPYMISAGKKLKMVYSRLLHTTCWAHILHLASEEIRAHYQMADAFIYHVKLALSKSPFRRQEVLAELNKFNLSRKLPPVPVITRWATWLEAGSYHHENYEAIRSWIENSESNSSTLIHLKKLIESETLFEELETIAKICPIISSTIKEFESNSLLSSNTWIKINKIKKILDEFRCPHAKLCMYIEGKQPAQSFFKSVQNLDPKLAKLKSKFELDEECFRFSCQAVPIEDITHYRLLLEDMDSESLDPLKFWEMHAKEMPILAEVAIKALLVPSSSASVERSFSLLKRTLQPQRSSLSEENLAIHLRLAFNKYESSIFE